MNNSELSLKCKECGGKLVVSEYGEVVCSECGLVHEKVYLQPLFEIEPLSDFSAIEKLYVSPDGKPLRVEGLGSTFIKVKGKFRDVRGKDIENPHFLKLKKIDAIYVKSRCKGLDASLSLRRVCSILNIPKNVYERASYIYGKILNVNKYFGTSYQLTAAALLIASRELKHPLTLRDLISIYRKLGHKISAKSIMRIVSSISTELSIKKVLRTPKDYLLHIINKLKANDIINRKIIYFTGKSPEEYYTELINYSSKIYELIDERFRIGKNPYLLATSIVYVADKVLCREKGYYQPVLSQKLVAETVGSTEYTIRQHCKYLDKIVNNTFNDRRNETIA
ncbi:MAG: transcription initiation factor IIB family protein [Candidatus Methanomethylicia archaeon]